MNFQNFNHFSNNKIEKLTSVSWTGVNDNFLKPPNRTFWMAPGFDWLNWQCYDENDMYTNNNLPGNNYWWYRLKSLDTNRILIIQTISEAEAFLTKYSKTICANYGQINWYQLSQEYHGIYLPYFSIHIRSDLLQKPSGIIFSCLDVDSLAIWNTDILEIELVNNR